MDLADTEQTDKAAGIFLEDQAVFRGDGAARHDAQPVHDERGAPPLGLRFAHDRAFDDFGATADVVGGVEILAHHPADTFRERAAIAEALGHRVLALQRKLFGGSRDLEMQLAAEAQQHLLGFLELLQVDRRQETGSREAGGADAISRRAGNPDAALDVAEGADAVLEVRLLQVGAAPGLFATLALGFHDSPRERLPSLARKQRRGLGFKLRVEFSRTAEVTGLQ